MPNKVVAVAHHRQCRDRVLAFVGRARGYIESNCAHCHNPDGSAENTGLYLEYDRPRDVVYGICKPPVAAGLEATGGLEYDIVPGQPDQSIFVYRMESRIRRKRL